MQGAVGASLCWRFNPVWGRYHDVVNRAAGRGIGLSGGRTVPEGAVARSVMTRDAHTGACFV